MDSLETKRTITSLESFLLTDCGSHHQLFETTNFAGYSEWCDHNYFIRSTPGNNEYCEQGCTFALLVLEALESE